MYLRLLVCLAVLSCALAQNRKKPGECPPYPDIGVCDMTCYSDFHCRGMDKCCRTACGGSTCTLPVTQRRTVPEKPGFCPDPPTGPWVCSSRCGKDSDCRGTKKCCKNRCGAFACVKPDSMSEVGKNMFDK